MRTVVAWALVGAIGLVVQVTLLAAFVGAGLATLPATILAVGMTVVHNYLWHERWTWRHRPATRLARRLARLGRFGVLTMLAALAGTVTLTTVLVDRFHVPLLAANVLAVAAVAVVNFLAAHHLVFTPVDRSPRRASAVVGVLIVLGLAGAGAVPTAGAAELQAATREAWARYVRAVEARTGRETSGGGQLLWPVSLSALRRGDIVVAETQIDGLDSQVPGGLIHHWRGSVMIPAVTLEQVLQELQSPDGRRHLQEDVLEWKMLSGPPESARIFLKLVRREIVTATYNTVHDVVYHRYGPARAASRSTAIRIAELEDANTPNEREKPEGDDRGFLWRLNSYWRYEQVPGGGGVVVQVESVTLSRQVPAIVRPIVGPIVDRIARESMVRTLDAVRRRFRASTSVPSSAGSA